MREYQQQAAGRLSTGDGGGDSAGGQTELTDLKHQLAKYKKYAKELRKTKENLLNTIQVGRNTVMDIKRCAQLKSLG